MSTVLLISPDFASHYYPLSAIGKELLLRGHRVVFGIGPGLAPRALSDGFETIEVRLGAGNNPGLMRTEDQTATEESQLLDFYEASRHGLISTLTHQARHRLDDLLWEPLRVSASIERAVELGPDVVVVDHLAYGATAALRGLGVDFISFHPGHPSAISAGMPYGMPKRIPARFAVDQDRLAELSDLCARVAGEFTRRYNHVVGQLDPTVPEVDDAFTASGRLTLVNYPSILGSGYDLPVGTRFIGSAPRQEAIPEELASRLAERSSKPRIYVSLGSFFSARSDLLHKIVTAFRDESVELVLASGVTPIADLGPIPSDWVVAPAFPQPPVLEYCDLVVTHGGNNTVTEALTAGVPLLIGPLSTDQFAGAADIEDFGFGSVFDPNRDTAATVANLTHHVLGGETPMRAEALGEWLRSNSGPEIAADLIEGLAGRKTPGTLAAAAGQVS
ncbi:MAG: glycosyltransferase [Acidimicrobiia bacterium]